MNYPESKIILEKIKKANNILINCHRGPDPDSIGSATALYQMLKNMGKQVRIVCPSKFPEADKFIPFSDKVEDKIDFSSFSYKDIDLFFCLDSSSWDMVSDSKELPVIKIPVVVIDHHKTNTRYGSINIVDDKRTSVGELLYLIFEDWGRGITKDIATSLLSGIIADTGAFRYANVGVETFDISEKLMIKGADKDQIILNIFNSLEYSLIKFWSEGFSRIKLDKKNKFVYSFIPFEIFRKNGTPENGKELLVNLFASSIINTDFGFVGVEQKKGILSLSFRSRTNFDTSKIAIELGGGGHAVASGARIQGLDFDKAVAKVLITARKFAKEYKYENEKI